MLILKAYKTELDPNNVQKTLLAKHAGAARHCRVCDAGRHRVRYQKKGLVRHV